MKFMHGDILTNCRESNKFFFILNPNLNPDDGKFTIVVQNIEDKADFRFISSAHLDGNPWSRYTNQTKEN